jgi:hypothetical protein
MDSNLNLGVDAGGSTEPIVQFPLDLVRDSHDSSLAVPVPKTKGLDTNIPYRGRLIRAAKSLDVLRRQKGLPLLAPFMKLGYVTFYDEGDLTSALGFSPTAFDYGLISLRYLPERRVCYHGALPSEDGPLSSEGGACVWYYNQGNVLYFADSRSGRVGSLSRRKCRKRLEQEQLLNGLVIPKKKKIKAKKVNNRSGVTHVTEDGGFVPPPKSKATQQYNVDCVMKTLEYLSALCNVVNSPIGKQIEFKAISAVVEDVVYEERPLLSGKGNKELLGDVFHEKPPYDCQRCAELGSVCEECDFVASAIIALELASQSFSYEGDATIASFRRDDGNIFRSAAQSVVKDVVPYIR